MTVPKISIIVLPSLEILANMLSQGKKKEDIVVIVYDMIIISEPPKIKN